MVGALDEYRHDESLFCHGCLLRPRLCPGGHGRCGCVYDGPDRYRCYAGRPCEVVCLERFDVLRLLEDPGLAALWSGAGAAGPPRALPPFVPTGTWRVRGARPGTPWVAVDAGALFRLSRRSGRPLAHLASPGALRDHLGVPHSARVLAYLNGTDDKLDGLFTMGPSAAVALRTAGVDLVGAPSYSVYADRPRPDHVFNLRRMFTVLADAEAQGLPIFPTVYAAGREDVRSWADWVRERPHVWVVGTVAQTREADFSDDLVRVLVRLQEAAGDRDPPLHAVLYGVASPERARRAHARGLRYFTCVSSHPAMTALFGARLRWDGRHLRPTPDHGAPRARLLEANVAEAARAYDALAEELTDLRPPGAWTRAGGRPRAA